jgi:hypothetical protein
MRTLLIAAAAFVLGGAVASAAEPGWKVFATGSDTNSYAGFANASADAPPSTALAVRATSSPGKSVKVSIVLSCNGDKRVPSGTLVVAWTSFFQKCSLNAAATTDYGGRLRVALLRR